ncbi:hypothetical protein FAM8407_00527 [Lacticaseibacillus paracasei]|nr:hypothetical protein FAM8407_00527 [Lacticaseibacillus paracasei]
MCHRIIPIGQRYCPVHQVQHEAEYQAKKDAYHKSKLGQAIKAQQAKRYDKLQRDPQATAFYHSKQWKKVRDAVYARDMATDQVTGEVLGDRKVVDHIIPLRLCTAKQALDSNNLWVLSYRTHYRKTKLEQIIANKQGGDSILRHLDKRWWMKVLRERKEEKNK